MNEKTIQSIRAHAAECYPKESCGLVIIERGREVYVPCRNVSALSNEFAINREDYTDAEDRGTIVCIVHSHPNRSPLPSECDKIECEKSGKPWLIVNWPTGAYHQFEPSGYESPLVGRRFYHGVQDCYSLVQDYFKRTLDIRLEDFDREYEWWNKGQNLYIDHFESQGFRVVRDTPKDHDVFFMQIRSEVVNHAAIYLGGGRILQHLANRLSSIDVYGGYYQKVTVLQVRHRSFI